MRILFKLKEIFLFFLILSIGIILRVYRLCSVSFWFDESLPLVMTGEGIKKALFSFKFYCPIIWDTFIHYYSNIIKDNALLLRLPPIIFGAFSILLLYRLGELIFDKKTALFSAFLLAISPFHVYYSREIRMYSLISLLSLISVYCLFMAIKENRNVHWCGYSIANIANIYIHPMMSLFFLAEFIFYIFYIKKYYHHLRKWIKVNIIIFILLIPWIISILSGFNLVIKRDNWFFELTLAWIPRIILASIFYTFKNFTIGYNAVRQVYLWAILLFFMLFLYGIFKKNKEKEGMALVLLCLLVPIFSAYFISRLSNCYLDRYFISSSLFYYLIIGKGLSEVNKKYSLFALGIIIILLSSAIRNYYINYLPGPVVREHVGIESRKEYAQAASYVARNFYEGDIIFHTCRNTIPSFNYYFSRYYKSKIPIAKNLILQWSKDNKELISFQYNTDNHQFIDWTNNISLDKKNRVWLIFSEWQFGSTLQESNSAESRVLKWMDQHYALENSKTFCGIIVYLYKNLVS